MAQSYNLLDRNIQQYDCLLYYARDDIANYSLPHRLQHQVIPYCIRPFADKNELSISIPANDTGNQITYEQLKIQGITYDELLSWSISIDIIEDYLAYENNSNDNEKIIYNCTWPWFGQYCQYTFNLSESSFDQIVKKTFAAKEHFQIGVLTNSTCYIHLKCNRGGICLDWREICDGKIDCIDGGQDEMHCHELETNECSTDQYRCHNGQCIPKDFFRDDILNPDCLDRTDEYNTDHYPFECPRDPAFRCEEHSCKPDGGSLGGARGEFTCGDGECSGGKKTSITRCANERDVLMMRAMFVQSDLSVQCWTTMICAVRQDHLFGITNCGKINHNLSKCPTFFFFPSVPIMHGHVRFAYTNLTIQKPIGNIIRTPEYICYDKRLCDFIRSLGKSFNESITCQKSSDWGLDSNYDTWKKLIDAVENVFQGCHSSIHSMQNKKFYRCENSSKFISEYRLVDGVRDCWMGDDETFNNSCMLNHKHRFKCLNGERKCITPQLVRNQIYDCLDKSDEDDVDMLEFHAYLSFSTLCDGFVDFEKGMNRNNETDETHCELWPCNNTFTRCDGYWNCLNGADEVNCYPSTCPPFEHLCVSFNTYNMTCLPIAQAGNGKVDCVGASDERQLCRNMILYPHERFRCVNSSVCLSDIYLCDGNTYCDDERFCQSSRLISPLCSRTWNGNRNIIEDLLCNLTDQDKPKIAYFSLRNSGNYPSTIITPVSSYENIVEEKKAEIAKQPTTVNPLKIDLNRAWYCYRGILIYVRRMPNQHIETLCLCPPSYYGPLCQYQNQRISLTVQLQTVIDHRTVFQLIITLIEDELGEINAHEQITYLAIRDCATKFNVYLLYSTQSKNLSKNYSVRIDAYNKHSLEYRTSWLFPIMMTFLPVHRMAIQLTIPPPSRSSDICFTLTCNHGTCTRYVNKVDTVFCRCDPGWSGQHCEIKFMNHCSSGSLNIGLDKNRSICVCPLEKFGPRCYLTHSSICKCNNDGVCIESEYQGFICICKEGYSGLHCENVDTSITISFDRRITIPQSIFVHFITLRTNAAPMRMTILKKVPYDQDSVTVYKSTEFHLVFIEFSNNYYLVLLQNVYKRWTHIDTSIILSHRCASINELFNSSVLEYPILRRVKLYHVPCQERSNLMCFYDLDTFMCLCNLDRLANCFQFDHNMKYDCRGNNYCENEGQCFQDNATCPTTSNCICAECFFGTHCQFSTKGFGLSLDAIIGYQILPHLSIFRQPLAIKVSIGLVTGIHIVGFVSGLLSILTFQRKNSQKVGCGLYLLASSITSIFTVTMFTLKFWLLILAQMTLITNRSFLLVQCMSIDFLVRIFLAIGGWLNACVAIERTVNAVKGINFNMVKSRRVAKWVTSTVCIFTVLTSFQEIIYRRLIDDEEEKRTWCIVSIPTYLQIVDSFMVAFHFIAPFCINCISALAIIIITARIRASTQQQVTYLEHLREQFQQHKHLLISQLVLILLSVPRLIISLLPGCMKSVRDPWLFLASYFVSFVPSISIFVVFVLPSDLYKSEFSAALKHLRTTIQHHLVILNPCRS